MSRKPKTLAPRLANAGPVGKFGADLELVDSSDSSLLDLLDNLLNNGVVLQGELVIGLANIDLIYARLSLLLCAADRVEELHSERKSLPKRLKSARRPSSLGRQSPGRSRGR